MSSTNWQLCCLCQSDKDEHLQSPEKEVILSLEKDLNGFKEIDAVPSGIAVSLEQLDDGSGMANTLRSNNCKYHKTSRSYFSSSRVKRLRQKQETTAQASPNRHDTNNSHC